MALLSPPHRSILWPHPGQLHRPSSIPLKHYSAQRESSPMCPAEPRPLVMAHTRTDAVLSTPKTCFLYSSKQPSGGLLSSVLEQGRLRPSVGTEAALEPGSPCGPFSLLGALPPSNFHAMHAVPCPGSLSPPGVLVPQTSAQHPLPSRIPSHGGTHSSVPLLGAVITVNSEGLAHT